MQVGNGNYEYCLLSYCPHDELPSYTLSRQNGFVRAYWHYEEEQINANYTDEAAGNKGNEYT
jgi:hypothetical protein